MIESCNKKRMLLGVICLGGLTLMVLIVESHWTEQKYHLTKTVNNSSKAEHHCWLTESFEIIKPCHLCSEFEIASKTVEACFPTHFKEEIKCHVSGKIQRSCTKVKWIEEKKYWMFEISMFILALISYSVVFVRHRMLDRKIVQRIQRQLANGLIN